MPLSERNLYCGNCGVTTRFLELENKLVCRQCSKRLEIIATTPKENGEPITTLREKRDGPQDSCASAEI